MVLPVKKITKVHKRTKKFIRHQSDRKICVKVRHPACNSSRTVSLRLRLQQPRTQQYPSDMCSRGGCRVWALVIGRMLHRLLGGLVPGSAAPMLDTTGEHGSMRLLV